MLSTLLPDLVLRIVSEFFLSLTTYINFFSLFISSIKNSLKVLLLFEALSLLHIEGVLQSPHNLFMQFDRLLSQGNNSSELLGFVYTLCKETGIFAYLIGRKKVP